ncbi:hypothetical protein OIDMADRAFT_57139 [Oidiodendron maius Zn]|uniref:Uncharacterized protein n=1 Tax=Oidiodendron maius (strain Zn) TaxID=913774 RepID=A0A0C3D6W1_OIDMZ|nr:hypothetical protein OIDMADRAFT_57139 [Oidiodendron maius Zn]
MGTMNLVGAWAVSTRKQATARARQALEQPEYYLRLRVSVGARPGMIWRPVPWLDQRRLYVAGWWLVEAVPIAPRAATDFMAGGMKLLGRQQLMVHQTVLTARGNNRAYILCRTHQCTHVQIREISSYMLSDRIASIRSTTALKIQYQVNSVSNPMTMLYLLPLGRDVRN